MPKVSVIIPVYNVEKYLRECLDSVINQTLKDIEIICIDDGSTDNSLSILEKYAKKDKRVKIIALNHNIKQGGARNRGLDIAVGKYIMFVDSDDYLALNTIESFYNAINKTGVDIVISSIHNFNMCKNTENMFCEMQKYINSTNKEEGIYYIDRNFTEFRVGPVAKLFKKSIIDKYKIRFPENIIQEDEAFHWCYFSVINSIYFLSGEYYYRRIHRLPYLLARCLRLERISDTGRYFRR